MTRTRSPLARWFPPALAFFLLWAGIQGMVLLFQHSEVLQGAQTDADGYMRLVRVRLLLDHGHWFDGSISRSNWPFGESIHWTRPLDVLIIALAAPFRWFMSPDAALAISGILISPMLHLILCLVAVWVVRPVVPGPERFLAMPAVLFQVGILGYGNPGRADHHILVFLLAFLALGSWIRALRSPEHSRPPLLAGLWSGMAIWVVPEGLLPLGILFLSGGIVWIVEGERLCKPNRRLSEGLLLGLGIAILLERPPPDLLTVDYDRISVMHLVIGALAFGFWRTVQTLSSRNTGRRLPLNSSLSRALVALAGGLITGSAMLIMFPAFLEGPWGDLDPLLYEAFLDRVPELQPIWPSSLAGLGPYLMHLGSAFLALPALAWWVYRDRGEAHQRVWILLLLSLLVFVPWTSLQVRLSGYAGMASAITLVELARRVSHWVRPRMASRLLRPLSAAGVKAAVIVGPLAVGTATSMMLTEAVPAPPTEPASCRLSSVAPFLADPKGFGNEPRAIATSLAFGPELLYRTPHRILAGPYHRNVDGMRAAFTFFTTDREAVARSIAEARELGLILICPARDEEGLDRGGPDGMYRRLVEGRSPPWIQEIILPSADAHGFRLYRIDREGG